MRYSNEPQLQLGQSRVYAPSACTRAPPRLHPSLILLPSSGLATHALAEHANEELLVDAHEFGDEGLEVEDFLAASHHAVLIKRRPVRHLVLQLVVERLQRIYARRAGREQRRYT